MERRRIGTTKKKIKYVVGESGYDLLKKYPLNKDKKKCKYYIFFYVFGGKKTFFCSVKNIIHIGSFYKNYSWKGFVLIGLYKKKNRGNLVRKMHT